jgi:D-glycero-beta-D-manno-heptose 1-phosphate adenylyltransferase
MMGKLKIIQSKIIDSVELDRTLSLWRFQQKIIVFTNGCFDILHRGHIEYLAKAASQGDVLVVGLNSDDSVRRIKGPTRPFQDELSRALILASLHFVDRVVLFEEDTPYNLISDVQPDILVKGADYKPEKIVGYDIVKAKGGKIVTIQLTEGFSTTNIIKKLDLS